MVFTVKREAFFFWRPPCICPSCILRTHATHLESSIWKDVFWMWGFFSLSPESLLPWQQQWSRSEGSWECERVSWACRGMAVPNKQALSLTVSRVLLLLLPSHCSPSPPPLTPLLSFEIRLLYSWFVVQLVSTLHSPPTDSPSYVF